MNKIDILEKTLLRYNYKWTAGKGNLYEPGDKREVKVIDANDHKQFVNFCKGIAMGSFKETDKVYFHNSVTFSRNKFREMFPTTKIVYKVENADAMIIDKEALIKQVDKYKSTNTIGMSQEDPRDGISYPTLTSDMFKLGVPEVGKFIMVDTGRYNVTESDVKEMNELIAFGKRFVNVDTIEIKSSLKIDDTSFSILNKLMSSGVSSNLQLACTMLGGFSYADSKHRMAALLKLNYNQWESYSDKKTFVDLRTTLNRLYKEFPYVQDPTPFGNVRFWVNALANYSEDEVIKYYTNKTLKDIFEHEGSEIELLIRKTGDSSIQFVPFTEQTLEMNTETNTLELKDESKLLENKEGDEVPVLGSPSN